MKIKKSLLLLLLSMVFMAVIFFVVYAYLLSKSFAPIDEIEFNQDTWKTGTQRAQMKFPRQAMVDELVRSRSLLQKTEKEISLMLGKPDSEFYDTNNVKVYTYFIGPARRLGSADDEWLELYFNSGNKVYKSELVIH